MIQDTQSVFQLANIAIIVKVVALILIGLFGIFSFMIAIKIRSFNKILFLPSNSGGNLMQRLTIIFSVSVAVLFLFALIVL